MEEKRAAVAAIAQEQVDNDDDDLDHDDDDLDHDDDDEDNGDNLLKNRSQIFMTILIMMMLMGPQEQVTTFK